MNKLRILSVTFDTPIAPWELRAFRGAVAAKAGYQHEHFHNHESVQGHAFDRLSFFGSAFLIPSFSST